MPQLGANNFTPNASSGSSTPSNFLGGGMYQAPGFGISGNAFNNPNYQQGAYGQAQGNYLNATTGQPVVANVNSGYTAGTAGQLGLANQYAQMAAGNGPSLAAIQAQQQGAQNLQATESMLGSARGAGNPAQAQLSAANANTAGQQQVAQNAVQGRTQEELGAMNAEGGLYGNVAGQGLTASGQANQVAQGNQANTTTAQTANLNSLSQQGLEQQAGQMQGQQLGVNQQLGLGQIGNQAYGNATTAQQNIGSGLFNGISGALGSIF